MFKRIIQYILFHSLLELLLFLSCPENSEIFLIDKSSLLSYDVGGHKHIYGLFYFRKGGSVMNNEVACQDIARMVTEQYVKGCNLDHVTFMS